MLDAIEAKKQAWRQASSESRQCTESVQKQRNELHRLESLARQASIKEKAAFQELNHALRSFDV